jgi:hypothetical protein
MLVTCKGPNEDLAKGLMTLDLGTWEPGVIDDYHPYIKVIIF